MSEQSQQPGDVTMMLQKAGTGDDEARQQLFQLLYEEIRSNARSQRFVGSYGDTLQPTALANEAYIEFQRKYPVMLEGTPDSRRLFFYTLGLVMKSILRDHSRKGGAKGKRMVALGEYDPDAEDANQREVDLGELDAAVDKLREYNERWGEVVHYRFFAGRTVRDTAEMLGVAESTVKSDWKLAQAWLTRELKLHE